MIYCFTSCTASYLPNARILAKSVRVWHPDWPIVLLFSDETPEEINWSEEPFDEVLFSNRLPIKDFRRWAFGYSVVELCTAVKGPMTRYLIEERGAEAVVYLDPDTVVFSRMTELEEALSNHGVVLTPHLTDREYSEEGIWSHERAALKHGTFNLGFFAFRNTAAGMACLNWWAHRVENYSQIDFDEGLFTDQKWANLIPYMFDDVFVLTKRTYNVATWNRINRQLRSDSGGAWFVGSEPLRLYHFSGFGHDFQWANRELELFARDGDRTPQLWDWYKEQYLANSLRARPEWAWARYQNRVPVPSVHRRLLRKNPKLGEGISDPRSVDMYERLSAASEA